MGLLRLSGKFVNLWRRSRTKITEPEGKRDRQETVTSTVLPAISAASLVFNEPTAYIVTGFTVGGAFAQETALEEEFIVEVPRELFPSLTAGVPRFHLNKFNQNVIFKNLLINIQQNSTLTFTFTRVSVTGGGSADVDITATLFIQDK